jgi:hypothetical protein
MLNRKFEIQEVLSLGYVYLLILGVIHSSIYYSFLGINFLDYSSLLDVLISPIAVLFSNKMLLITTVVCIIVCVVYSKYMPKYLERLKSKKKNLSEKKIAKIDKSLEAFNANGFVIIMTALMVFSLFIGLGLGKGFKRADQIEKQELKVDHELVFSNGDKETVKVLGKNSLYVFYVIEDQKEITIAPIEGNIKTIKKISK